MNGHDGMTADDRLHALELHLAAVDQRTADLSDRVTALEQRLDHLSDHRVSALEVDVHSIRRAARFWLR